MISKKIQKLLNIVNKAEELSTPLLKKQRKKKILKIIDHTHLVRFIRHFDIKSGPNKIDTFVLWYLYNTEWRTLRKEILYSKIEFFRKLSKYFISGRYNRRRFYLLNMEVTNEIKEKAKNYKNE